MTRLLHLSDTHLHAPGAERLHPEIDVHARLTEVIDRMRAYGPFDAVVVTGDVCDDGSVEGAHAVRAALKGLAPVVLAVPGNHDLPGPVREAFGSPTATVGPWLIHGIETQIERTVEGHGGQVSRALNEIGDRPTVLLMHHPIESRSTHEWFVLRDRAETAESVAAHTPPLVVLSGHTHEAYQGRLGEAHLIGAPSTYYSIRHRGDEFDFVASEFGAAVIDLGDPGQDPTTEVVILTDDKTTIDDRITVNEGA